MIARPTKSLVLYSQMVGRATRGPKAGGNKEAEIVTVIDQHLPGFDSVVAAFKNWRMFGMTRPETTSSSERFIIPPELAIRAMRDSGYRNTAYALSELIDNSVQAGAENVDVICIEERQMIKKRERRRISAIGVLDNGSGMKPEVLQLALQFGNGTHLQDRSGIGRFGMGLPNSSISQCRRVEVWTWKNGPDNAMYTYLDVDEVESGSLTAVPVPQGDALPVEWRNRSDIVHTTGTLVLWRNFDDYRLTWRGARATLRNTETFIGRMYRKFIDNGQLTIRLLAMENEKPTFEEYVRVNDPLYLMENSSTPPPFDKEPMFQKWGERMRNSTLTTVA